ncbi:MAG: hypothetical protein HOM11_08065 [Methylococcales bacterium]|jgi:hypothetical protein|nr:hypothetical protein [Methylococcales bacterium]MBT7443146.1 hypothetical protein [Methylococcales bacterium]
MHIANRVNAALFIIILLLSYWIWTQYQPEPQHRLLPINPENITSIDIKPQQQPIIQVSKVNGLWVMPEHQNTPANQTLIDALLDMTQAEILVDYPAPDDLTPYGLATPTTIRFNHQEIHLGKLDPIKQQRYLLLNNRLIFIFDRYTHNLSQSVFSPQIQPFSSPIQSLQLTNLSLNKQPDASWQSTGHIKPEKISALIDLWQNAKAHRVTQLSQPPKKHHIQIILADETILQFWYDVDAGSLTRLKPAIRYYLSPEILSQLMP